MLTFVLRKHVVFLCVSRTCTLFIMSLVMVVRRVLCSVRRTTITRLIINSVHVRLAHKNTTCCHNTEVNIKK